MVRNYTVQDIGQLVNAINTIRRDHFAGEHPWFRGHSDPDWLLQPGIFRDNRYLNEVDINFAFRSKARLRSHTTCPPDEDHLSWLYLMQHYGVPTRILDWTESPLVALHFALNNQRRIHMELYRQGKVGDEYQSAFATHRDTAEAKLWALWPTRIAHYQTGQAGVPVAGNSDVQLQAHAAFDKSVDGTDSILPVLPSEADMRHFVQQSTFTIHGMSTSIEQLDCADEILVSITLPIESLPHLGISMETLKIKQSTLFPDLENLAEEVGQILWLN